MELQVTDYPEGALRDCDECGRVTDAGEYPDWVNGVCEECDPSILAATVEQRCKHGRTLTQGCGDCLAPEGWTLQERYDAARIAGMDHDQALARAQDLGGEE